MQTEVSRMTRYNQFSAVAIAVGLAVVFIVAAMPVTRQVSAFPQSDGSSFVDDTGEYQCQVIDGQVTIAGEAKGDYATNVRYSSADTLTIPSTVTSQGCIYEVTAIGDGALSLVNYQDVIIPSAIVKIGNSVFAGNPIVKSVEFQGEVSSFGDSVFAGCEYLTSVTLSEDMTVIPADTFMGCTSLESIVIPEDVTRISADAFADCSSLTTVDMGGSAVRIIADNAFSGCNALSTVIFSDDLTTLGSQAFDVTFTDADNNVLTVASDLIGKTFTGAAGPLVEYAIPINETVLDMNAEIILITCLILAGFLVCGVAGAAYHWAKRVVYE